MIGHHVHHEAARVLESLGGDPSDFAARQLTAKIASDADLVLTMTKTHRNSVLEIAPRLLRRTYTLTEAARLAGSRHAQSIDELATLRPQLTASDVLDIPDPIGQFAEVFAAVGSQIADLLPPILGLCQRLSPSAAD